MSVAMLAVLLLAVSMPAGANPRPVLKDPDTEPVEFWAVLFFVNFFLNLFWFSLFMLILLSWKGKAAAGIRFGRMRFHALTLATVAVLTVLGAVIDRTFLYESVGGWLYPVRDAARWALPAILVGLSVVVVPTILLSVRLRYGLLLSAGMVAMNLFWWGLVGNLLFAGLWCMPGIFALLVPLVFLELDRWYRKEYTQKGAPVLDAATWLGR